MGGQCPYDQLRILEACRRAADEYGWPPGELKPCIAYLLDGNIGATDRHEVAFLVAIEARRAGIDQATAERLLKRWARKVEYEPRRVQRSVASAFAKNPQGGWRYWPPGFAKKPGSLAHRVLLPLCEEVGCPRACPPLANIVRNRGGGTLERYAALGWPAYHRRRRHSAADEIYREITRLERERGIAPGGPIRTSYRQLSERPGRDHSKVGQHLDYLRDVGLVQEFERGSGSGPEARDRRGTRVTRRIPIPAPPPDHYRTSLHRSPDATHIAGGRQPQIGGGQPPDIGGAPNGSAGTP